MSVIRTEHIRAMLAEAAAIAELVDGRVAGQRIDATTHVRLGRPDVLVDVALERAANLAAHAAEELRDEATRARDGWRVV